MATAKQVNTNSVVRRFMAGNLAQSGGSMGANGPSLANVSGATILADYGRRPRVEAKSG